VRAVARRAGALGAIASVLVGATGCGSGERDQAGRLVWAKPPVVFSEANDRVLQGMIRNNGLQRVDMVASDLRMLDAQGRRVPGVATFALGYVHSNYPLTREPDLPDSEQRRLGRRTYIEPGRQVKLTLAWRVARGKGWPVSVSYGTGRLPIPAGR
jgi:hypothetical protein